MSVEVAGLGFDYNGRGVLDGISFCVGAGESVAVLGANGAGKSTLLWCVLGLLKARGTVRLFGSRPDRKTLARCGVVFQNPEDQLFMPAILDDITLGLLNRGASREAARAAALSALQQVGLEAHAGDPAGRLSLGQRKRAAIAVALASRPQLLVMDEPTAELDGRSARELAASLNRLSVTKLIASHDLAFVGRTAERVIVLDSGRIAQQGPAEEILGNRALLEASGLA